MRRDLLNHMVLVEVGLAVDLENSNINEVKANNISLQTGIFLA